MLQHVDIRNISEPSVPAADNGDERKIKPLARAADDGEGSNKNTLKQISYDDVEQSEHMGDTVRV